MNSQFQTHFAEVSEIKRRELPIEQPICEAFNNLCICDVGQVCKGCFVARFFDQEERETMRLVLAQNEQESYEQIWDPSIMTSNNFLSTESQSIMYYFEICNEDGQPEPKIDYFFSLKTGIPLSIQCTDCKGAILANSFVGQIQLYPVEAVPFKALIVEIYKITFHNQKIADTETCCNSGHTFGKIDECPVCEYNILVSSNGMMYEQKQIKLLSIYPVQETSLKYFVIHEEGITKESNLLIQVVEEAGNKPIIDQISAAMHSELPYTKKFFDLPGDYSHVTLNFSVHSIGYEYGGYNSFNRCRYLTFETSCDNDGNLICSDPIKANPPFCIAKNNICTVENPCQNGGICTGTLNYYECTCLKGFGGKNCEEKICDNTCLNSKCVWPDKCEECPEGWTGNSCDERTCDSYTKCHSGKCDIVNDEFTCICDAKKAAGPRCQFLCTPNCINGTCQNDGKHAFCICNEGWYGTTCERDTEFYQEVFTKDTNFLILIGCIVGVIGAVTIIVSVLIVFVNNKKKK